MDTTTYPSNLTGDRLLARNTIWNLIGQGVPILVAILVIPMLIKGMGIDRFGVLTLVWILIGYFSLFDLGMGRALIQLVAAKLGEGKSEGLPSSVWTALCLMLVMGLLAGLVLLLISSRLVCDVLEIPDHLQPETLMAFYLLSASIPLVITTTGLRGILAAHQRFDLINAIRLPAGVLNYLGPLLVLLFSHSLVPIVALLLIVRFVTWVLYVFLCLNVMTALRWDLRVARASIGPLVRMGGWITVSNVVGPLMVYSDRFLIGALISASAVAYYATPYEVVTKLWVFPSAMMGVIFPAFASSFVSDRNRMVQLFNQGMKCILLVMFPITLIIVTFARDVLGVWLGAEFAKNSTGVMQLLTIGVFFNSLAWPSLAFLQGSGRPDITAKLHLIELPCYLLAVWWLISVHGITGAAVAWVSRVGLDMILLLGMARRFLPPDTLVLRPIMLIGSGSLLILVAASVMEGLAVKGAFLVCTLLTFMLLSWFFILASEERLVVRNLLDSMLQSRKSTS